MEFAVFGAFIGWLFEQRIDLSRDSKSLRANDGVLMNLWLLGDRIGIPTLQNHAIIELDKARCEKGAVDSREFHRMFAKTERDSPLQQFIIDSWNGHHAINCPNNYPQELLVGLVTLLGTRIRTSQKVPSFTQEELTKYHVNENVPRSILEIRKVTSEVGCQTLGDEGTGISTPISEVLDRSGAEKEELQRAGRISDTSTLIGALDLSGEPDCLRRLCCNFGNIKQLSKRKGGTPMV
jgi:hypothetical protein